MFRKSALRPLLVLLLALTLQVAPTQAQGGIETCDFYQTWLEPQIPCGPKGYAMGYGYHYCRKFMARIDHFSDRGKVWMTEAMLCLQDYLRGYMAEQGDQLPSCRVLKKAAFDSHPACYTSGEVSFCELKARDYWQLGKILSVRDTLFSRAGLKQIKEVAKICLVMRRATSSMVGDRESRDAILALEKLVQLGESEYPGPGPLENLVGTEVGGR
jgi:hypothetical protein